MNKVAVMALVLLSGCSHAYVSKFGNGEVTTCCPDGEPSCSEKKLYKAAEKKCGGIAFEDSEGIGYGANVQTSADAGAPKNVCMRYKCGTSEQRNQALQDRAEKRHQTWQAIGTAMQGASQGLMTRPQQNPRPVNCTTLYGNGLATTDCN